MNKPYVKEYNEDGICTNPIKGSYESQFPNRRQRNQKIDKNANRKLDYVQVVTKGSAFTKVSSKDVPSLRDPKIITKHVKYIPNEKVAFVKLVAHYDNN